MGKIIDITGQTFGYLTALYPTRKNNRFAWHCVCQCGKEVDVDSSNLRSGKTQSCGCQKKISISQKMKKDLVGEKIGLLTILEATDKRSGGSIVWKCQCDCGNICYIPTGNLSRGHTKSCGCATAKFIGDSQRLKLVGQQFGRLTVLQELESINLESRWLCVCECGSQIEVVGWHLTKGIVNSCGCLKSKGEMKIKQLLTEANIPFVAEATFDTCLSPKGYKLRFDFFVNNEYLIEFDGQQHSLDQPHGYFSKERLDTIKKHDNIKTQWCLDNNIPLLRIDYTRLNDLSIEDLILLKEEENNNGY